MKRSPMVRKTPLCSTKPMARGTTYMRARKPAAQKRKRLAYAGEGDKCCHGQQCYLLIPRICRNDPGTVVPTHSNQYIHGKGKGIKAKNEFTVPGCFWCHFEIDQGVRFSKQEKFLFWDQGFERWRPVRQQLFGF